MSQNVSACFRCVMPRLIWVFAVCSMVSLDQSFLHADSKDSDQTGRIPRLIWVFAGRTCHFVGFVTMRLSLLEMQSIVDNESKCFCLFQSLGARTVMKTLHSTTQRFCHMSCTLSNTHLVFILHHYFSYHFISFFTAQMFPWHIFLSFANILSCISHNYMLCMFKFVFHCTIGIYAEGYTVFAFHLRLFVHTSFRRVSGI